MHAACAFCLIFVAGSEAPEFLKPVDPAQDNPLLIRGPELFPAQAARAQPGASAAPHAPRRRCRLGRPARLTQLGRPAVPPSGR